MYDDEVTIVRSASPTIEFEVPSDAIAVHISVFGVPEETYGLGRWVNGDGTELVTGGWVNTDPGFPQLCIRCPNRVVLSEAAFGALAPNNGSVELVPGTHNIYVYGGRQSGLNVRELAERDVRVRIVAKLAPAEPDVGRLNINFYFTGSRWSAETAQTDPQFAATVESVSQILSTTGVSVGDLTYTNISDEFQVVANVIAPGSQVQEMWELSKDNSKSAINVFS